MHLLLHVRGDQVVGVIPPPSGTSPDFINPPSVKHVLLATIISFTLLSFVFVVMRLYTNRCIIRKTGFEDSMVVFAWLLALGSSITWMLDTRYGFGIHLWDIPLSIYVPNFWLVGSIAAMFCGLSIMFSKLSILLFYVRFCRYRRLRIVIYTAIVIVTIYSVISSFEFLYACRPAAKLWDPRITRGSCIDTRVIPAFNGVMNTTTDCVILLLPILMLWSVQIPKRQKIGLILIFMTGGFVVVVSIVRLKMSFDFMQITDISWFGVYLVSWWMVEMHVAVVCACLPAAKPFLRRHFPKVLGSSFLSTNKATTPSHNVQRLPARDGDEVLLSEFMAPGLDESEANVSTSTVERVV